MTVDEQLQDFLRDNVSSFEELEILLLLVRAPRRAWSTAEVAVSVGLPEELVARALDTLASSSRLVERATNTGSPQLYRLVAPDDAQTVLEKLRRVYDEQRVSIMRIMTANALARVRSSAAQRLADALRLDRGKK